jgi:hypothetical protein
MAREGSRVMEMEAGQSPLAQVRRRQVEQESGC